MRRAFSHCSTRRCLVSYIHIHMRMYTHNVRTKAAELLSLNTYVRRVSELERGKTFAPAELVKRARLCTNAWSVACLFKIYTCGCFRRCRPDFFRSCCPRQKLSATILDSSFQRTASPQISCFVIFSFFSFLAITLPSVYPPRIRRFVYYRESGITGSYIKRRNSDVTHCKRLRG